MSFYRLLIGIIISILLLPNAQSQFTYHDQGAPVPVDSLERLLPSAQLIYDSIRARGINVNRADIVEISDKPYLLIDGTFNVFEWEGDKWVNRYNNIFFGYNFKSTKFVYKDHIYSLGGYGFWNSHGQLIEFLPSRGEWEIINSTRGMPYATGYIYEDMLYLYTQDSAYVMDVKDHFSLVANKSYRLSIPNMDLKNNFYNFENYGLIYVSGSHYLIEKQTGQLYKSILSPFKMILESYGKGLTVIRGDSILCYNDHLKPLDSYSVKAELKFFERQKTMDSEPRSNHYKILLIVLIFMLVVIALSFWIYRSMKRNQVLESFDQLSTNIHESYPIIGKLVAYAGQLLSQDELDEIFEIIDIPTSETQRYKRAQIIREVNQTYERYYNIELIVRKRDIKDKRVYVYEINSEPQKEN
ncbi:MAG: hypothetical protein LC107_11795 [Chitinophagales bacterium]|nr:hypothetical protein [Chitinophagales bacterium]